MSTTVSRQDVVFTSYIGYDKSLSLDNRLGCNLNNTVILTDIPASTTSSVGQYIFSKDGDAVILNATGSHAGGSLKLQGVSATEQPTTFLTANHTGISTNTVSTLGVDANNAPAVSTLNSTQLLFNNVDYKALIDTHTQQIFQLGGGEVDLYAKTADLYAIDARLTSDVTALQHLQPLIISNPIYNVASVHADSSGSVDYIPASVSNVTPYSGFYYKNNLNEEVNWYIPPDIGVTVGQIKGLMLNFYNVSATSGSGLPFVSVYTKPDNTSPNASSWYKSRRTFMVDYVNVTPSANTAYALLANLKSLHYTPSAYGHNITNAITIPGNDKGTFADSESILFYSVGTSSNSQAGTFEFIASKLTILTAKTSNEFVFQQK